MNKGKEEYLKKLKAIKLCVANMIVTYDMGLQFDVITSEGATTNIGNVGSWPCMEFQLTEGFKEIHAKICAGEKIENTEIENDSICREICTYHDMYNGDRCLEGSQFEECIDSIKDGIAELELPHSTFYVYASLEAWDTEIKMFDTLEAMKDFFISSLGACVDDYGDMTLEQIKYWYDVAEENDWDSLPYLTFNTKDNEL